MSALFCNKKLRIVKNCDSNMDSLCHCGKDTLGL